MSEPSQLHFLSSDDFRLPHYVSSDGALVSRPADGIPLFQWPDGSWCPDANRFMRQLYERQLSRTNRGGTLATQAAHITHLLRFCWKRNLSLHDLTDADFTAFVAELSSAVDVKGRRRRLASTVLEIGRSCLALLEAASSHSGTPTGVRVQSKPSSARGKSHNRRSPNLWHASFPNPSPKTRRIPVSAQEIRLLNDAAAQDSRNALQMMRRLIMLRLLEITGGRRAEIAAMKVQSVLEASDMDKPMLRIITLKTRASAPPERLIPVNHTDLSFISTYIRVYRTPFVSRRFTKDHGFLLVNCTTGSPLRAGTITNEIRKLAKLTQQKRRISPHLFRHRYITKLFMALIEQHGAETPDAFRRMLLDGESLKRKVAEWTGHSCLDSLNQYIHLAFDEIGDARPFLNAAKARDAITAFLEQLRVRDNGDTTIHSCELVAATLALKRDLDLI